MSRPAPEYGRRDHPAELERLHQRVLAGTPWQSRFVEPRAGQRIHLVEAGSGPPVVLLHGTTGSALTLFPLLKHLAGVRAIAPDRPGQGRSERIALPRERYREVAVGWLDRLLDTLALDSATLFGHSFGGLWALWYALAYPDRVDRLVLAGTPALPGTRCPVPIRLIATPGIGELIGRLNPSPRAVRQFARRMGEPTIGDHPEVVDAMVAAGADPVTTAVDRREVRVIVPPYSLGMPSGFRRTARVRPDDLRRLAVPTLVLWGERDPVGSASVARAVTGLIPGARLETLPSGHAPWLRCPERAAAIVSGFVAERSGWPARSAGYAGRHQPG